MDTFCRNNKIKIIITVISIITILIIECHLCQIFMGWKNSSELQIPSLLMSILFESLVNSDEQIIPKSVLLLSVFKLS